MSMDSYNRAVATLGVAHVQATVSVGTLDALCATTAAVRGLEPAGLGPYGHQDSSLMRWISAAEASRSRACARRYWNANL